MKGRKSESEQLGPEPSGTVVGQLTSLDQWGSGRAAMAAPADSALHHYRCVCGGFLQHDRELCLSGEEHPFQIIKISSKQSIRGSRRQVAAGGAGNSYPLPPCFRSASGLRSGIQLPGFL